MSLAALLKSLQADVRGQIEAVQGILADLGSGTRRTTHPTPERGSTDHSSRVLIIGAGISGLALAHGLRRAGVPFHVFERDLPLVGQQRSYRLRIDADGANALKAILSPQLWTRFERTCAGTTILETGIDAVKGRLTETRLGDRKDGTVYTTDRNVLRAILSAGVDPYITYGKHFIDYSLTKNGVEANFLDGTSEPGAFLVGADGHTSRVREQYLPGHLSMDTDGCCISGKTTWTHEIIGKYPGRPTKSTIFVVDGRSKSKGIHACAASFLIIEPIRFRRNRFQDQVPTDYLHWVLVCMGGTFGVAEDQFLTMSAEAVAQLSIQATQDWDEKMRAVLESQDITQTVAMRLPAMPSKVGVWPASDRVTLVGDAIRVTSPLSSTGANAALRDAVELSKSLGQEGLLVQTIEDFEMGMRDRIEKQLRPGSGVARGTSRRVKTTGSGKK